MEELFNCEHSKIIKIYVGNETTIDPFEKNVEVTMLNPIPIRGIVTDLTTTTAQWKMPGIVADKAKEIIIPKRYRNLLEMSQKIQVQDDDDYYEGWRQNSKMQIREEGEYLRIYIYVKKS